MVNSQEVSHLSHFLVSGNELVHAFVDPERIINFFELKIERMGDAGAHLQENMSNFMEVFGSSVT